MRTTVAKLGTYVATMAIVALAAPISALAEPVALTSGAFTVLRFDNAVLSAFPTADTGVGAYLGASDAFKYYPPYICDVGECAGRTFNLSISDSLTRTPNGANNVVGGVFNLGETLYFVDSIVYSITAGFVTGREDGAASTWFRFAGTLAGTTTDGLSRTLNLIGGGTAVSSWNSKWGWVNTNYNFEDPAAVPEPATLLLIGTGLVAVGGRLRRRPSVRG